MGNGSSAACSARRRKPLPLAPWPHQTGSVTEPCDAFETPKRRRQRPETQYFGTKPIALGGAAKRSFDLIGAIAAITLLLPLFCLVALMIKLSDHGPVFYRHKRVGLNGSSFDCLKFRTMAVDADQALQRHLAANRDAAHEWQELRKLKNDPRVTRLGHTMRKTSLDELPQLINILKGEMSFVGPRPIVVAELPRYGECIGHYLRARPGLTGPWQISGRNDVDYIKRVALDRDYVEAWSFWRDLLIITRTVGVVVTARGCY